MRWTLLVCFLGFNLMAQSNLSELPADVQKDIKTTEDVVLQAKDTPAMAKAIVVQDEKTMPVVDKTSAKESEIPLSVETSKKVASSESPFFKIIMVIALLGILACGTWIFVRKSKFQNIKRNKNEIKILAQHYLGPRKV